MLKVIQMPMNWNALVKEKRILTGLSSLAREVT
jgi:hypothetical protein